MERKISSVLRQLREKEKATQGELSEKTGIPQAYISKIEKGKKIPSREQVKKISEFFGVDEKKLLKLSGYYDDILQESISIEEELRKINKKLNSLTCNSSKLFRYPVISGVAKCGDTGVFSEETIEDFIELPCRVNNANFVIKACGNSMKEEGIQDGMLVFIKKQNTCITEDIVLVSVYEGETPQLVFKKAKEIAPSLIILKSGDGEDMVLNENTFIVGKKVFVMEDIREIREDNTSEKFIEDNTFYLNIIKYLEEEKTFLLQELLKSEIMDEGLSLLEYGNYTGALSFYDQEIYKAQDRDYIWYRKGISCLLLSKYLVAEQACNKAIKLNSSVNNWYLKFITLAYQGMDRKKEAKFCLEKTLEMSSGKTFASSPDKTDKIISLFYS